MSDGSIRIDTKIGTENVSKDLKKLSASLKDGVEKAAKGATVALAGVAAGIAGIAAVSKKFADTTGRIADMSQALGLSKRGFQELDYALKLSGSSIDSMQMGMKALMEKAESGSKDFDRLGVSIRNVDGSMRNQEDILRETISAFQRMENGTEKAMLAQELFSRSGQELMPILNAEAGNLEELTKRAGELGLVLSDETISAGEALGDAFDELELSGKTLISNIFAPFAPLVKNVANWMMELTGNVSTAVTTHTQLSRETKTLMEATNNYKVAVQNLDSAQKDITDTERTLLKGRKELARLALEKALAETSKGYAKTTEQVAKLKKEEADRIAALSGQSLLMKQLEDIINGPADAARDAGAALGLTSIESAREVYAAEARTFEVLNMNLIETQTKLTAVSTEQAEAIAEIARAVNDGTLNIDIYKTTNRALYDDIMASAEAQKLLNETIEDAPKEGTAPAGGNRDEGSLDETYTRMIEARKAAQAEYEKAIDISNAKANAGLITQEENTKNVNSAAQRYMDTLLSLGYRFGDMTTLGGQALEQLREHLKLTTEETQELSEETQELSEEEEALAAIRVKTDKEAAILNDKVLAGILSEKEEREALIALCESQIDALYQMGATSDGSDEKSAALREYIESMNRLKKVSGDVAPVAEKGLRGVLLAIRDKSSGIVNQVQVMMGKMSNVIGSGFSFVKGVFSKGFSLLSNLAKFDPNAMLASLQEFLTGVENFFTVDLALSPAWLKSAVEMIGSFLSGIIQNLPAIMTTFGNAINQLAALIIQYAPTFIESAGQIIMALIMGLADAAPQLVTAAVTVIMSLVTFILDNLPELIMAAVQMIVALINGLGQALPSLIYAIVNALPEIISAIITAFPMIVQAIVDNLPAIIEAVLYAIPMIVEALIQAIPELLVAVGKIAYSLIEGLWNGIGAAFSGLFKGLGDLFWEWIIKPIRKLFDMHSPSKVFASLGGDMIQGLFNGILSAGGAIWDAVKGIFTGLWDNIKNVFSGAWDLGKSVVSAIGDGIKGVASGAVDLAKGAGSAIVSGVKTAGSAIVSGASAVGGAVASGASAVASGAGKVLKKMKFWDVGSPNISADHVAMVHKGERIVPKTFNQDLMSGKTMMLAPEALSSIMASFTGLGRQSVNISGVVPVMINDREIGRAAFEWLDVAAGGAYGY